MPTSVDRPGVDPILQKVLEAAPFALTVDGGIADARRRLRELPRRRVHPQLRVEDHAIDGSGGPIPVRVYWPDDADVEVELHNADTLVHGYLGYAGVVPAATEATERGLAALRRALHG